VLPISFDKDRAEVLLTEFELGAEIPPPEICGNGCNRWSRNDLLLLASAAYFAAFVQGPTDMTDDQFDAMPLKLQEADEETRRNDFHAAIDAQIALLTHLNEESYDELYDPIVGLVAWKDSTGESQSRLISGDRPATEYRRRCLRGILGRIDAQIERAEQLAESGPNDDALGIASRQLIELRSVLADVERKLTPSNPK
jgi:hypothetical protein